MTPVVGSTTTVELGATDGSTAPATVVVVAAASAADNVVGGAIGLPYSSTYTTRWMVSSKVVGGAASACLDSAARASAVASEAMVAKKPEVASPVARMRPAAAT
ncbi:MAG: hypothetical protein ACXVLX_13115 [Ilumatobacteraceae bacterium]